MTSGDDGRDGRLLELFLEEVEEQLERMAAGLELLAAAGNESQGEVVDDLFRRAHSIKGAAQAVGERRVARACHDLEDLLAQVRDGVLEVDATLVGQLNRLVDTVARQMAGSARPTQNVPAEPVGDTTVTKAAAPAGGVVTSEKPASSRTGAAGAPPRTSAHRVEELMEEADRLVAASYGADDLLRALSRTEHALARELASQQRFLWSMVNELAIADREPVEHTIRGTADRNEELCRELGRVRALLSGHHRTLRVSAHRFQEAARRARMVPFDRATEGLARMVRELAAELGKVADLHVTATDVEVDRDLVLMLREVLGHLVRNAIDHGVETPAERERLGKPRRGRVTIEAGLGGDGVRVVVADDGAGLDTEALRRAAEAVIGAADMEAADPTEAMFAAGVSTAAGVSNVSGRGVGLDAVRTTVEAAGGSVEVQSMPGRGTRMALLLPLNLSTMRALMVQTAGQTLAFPSASVTRLITTPVVQPRLDGATVLTLDEEVLAVAPLHRILGWEPPHESASGSTGLVVSGPSQSAVLAVEAVLTEREVVLHASSSRLDGVPELLGTTQLDDGSIVLVLNPAACVRAALLDQAPHATESAGVSVGRRSVLLAEDSPTTRELERSLLEAAGYEVLVAHDGLQAWDLLQRHEVDAVVSDINMPHMDGIALCRAIRGSHRLLNLPVVLVTALHSEADRRAGLDAGADAYLTKVGLKRDELIDTLGRLL